MRLPSTLLLLLATALLAAAESTAECKDGLDKLNNKAGESPCTVLGQLMEACNDSASGISPCRCNTIVYNIGAACAACAAESLPNWSQWANDSSCESNPGQFPSDLHSAHNIIPQWAYLPLTHDNEFNMSAAILAASDTASTLNASTTASSKPNVAAQVAVPIAAGVGVALIATTLFWFYWRRRTQRHRNPLMKALPRIPGAQSPFWRPWRWFYTLWPTARSRRLRPSKKNSDWAIDDDGEDSEWLGSVHTRAQSSASYVDPYAFAHPHAAEPEPLELPDVPHTSAHLHETSSSSLLPHLDFPDVRVPTFFERFIKSKDGIPKSAAYKSKYVSPVLPDPQFRIDSSGETPARAEFAVPGARAEIAMGAGARISGSGVGGASASASARPAVVERSDFEPPSVGVGSSVLLISRDGEDFSMDDSATTAPSHSHPSSPRTPSTFRQTYSSFSGTRTNTTRTGTGTGTGSWLPSPNRANTSSTLSGAYPTELRRDPDLASPRTWASRFPAPPQMFSTSPTAFKSFDLGEEMDTLPNHEHGRGRDS